MKLGVFNYTLDLSVRAYIDNVVRELQALGVEVSSFVTGEVLPEDMDLYWDPRLTGATPPWHVLQTTAKPRVVTMHDGAPLTMPPWEYYSNLRLAVRGLWGVVKRLYYWRGWRGKCSAIITVSASAKVEIERKLGLRGENIIPIYHGVDHALFRPPDVPVEEDAYLLHVSAYQPKKNFHRLVSAYHQLQMVHKPRLVAIVPRYPEEDAGPGVELIREPMSHEVVATFYQGAIGFVFPSLHETFGMPIIEAMACGCPVITSNITACPEIAGGAALLVNPRSVDEIAEAMHRLIEDRELRGTLREKGIERASQFTWRKCAEEHLRVFNEAVRSG